MFLEVEVIGALSPGGDVVALTPSKEVFALRRILRLYPLHRGHSETNAVLVLETSENNPKAPLVLRESYSRVVASLREGL